MRRKSKEKSLHALKLLAAVVCCVCSAALCSCSEIYNVFNVSDSAAPKYIVPTSAQKDELPSEKNIIEESGRFEAWESFVTNSAFFFDETSDIKTTDDTTALDGENAQTTLGYGSYPCIDGSAFCIPLAVEFARQHMDFSADRCHDLYSVFSGTSAAYENLITKKSIQSYYYDEFFESIINLQEKEPDLFLGLEPSDAEEVLGKKQGVELLKKPVARDGLIITVSSENPVNGLTLQELRDIYSGKITNWSEVGGKDEKIVAYQREDGSDSNEIFQRLVMKDELMIAPPVIYKEDKLYGKIELVAGFNPQNSGGIGYTTLFCAKRMYENIGVKYLRVDGVDATEENIKGKEYKLSFDYYGVIRKDDAKKTGGKFLDWIISEEGRKSVDQAGFIAIE